MTPVAPCKKFACCKPKVACCIACVCCASRFFVSLCCNALHVVALHVVAKCCACCCALLCCCCKVLRALHRVAFRFVAHVVAFRFVVALLLLLCIARIALLFVSLLLLLRWSCHDKRCQSVSHVVALLLCIALHVVQSNIDINAARRN